MLRPCAFDGSPLTFVSRVPKLLGPWISALSEVNHGFYSERPD